MSRHHSHPDSVEGISLSDDKQTLYVRTDGRPDTVPPDIRAWAESEGYTHWETHTADGLNATDFRIWVFKYDDETYSRDDDQTAPGLSDDHLADTASTQSQQRRTRYGGNSTDATPPRVIPAVNLPTEYH